MGIYGLKKITLDLHVFLKVYTWRIDAENILGISTYMYICICTYAYAYVMKQSSHSIQMGLLIFSLNLEKKHFNNVVRKNGYVL